MRTRSGVAGSMVHLGREASMRGSFLRTALAFVVIVALNVDMVIVARADPGVFDDRIVFG